MRVIVVVVVVVVVGCGEVVLWIGSGWRGF
jgi:hypothetical protein